MTQVNESITRAAQASSMIGFGIALLVSCSSPAAAQDEHSKPHKSFHGLADYYHSKFHGRRTASGQPHDKNRLTAAHRTLPFGTKVKLRNKRNGKECVVTINDRGPFTPSKVIDVSQEAARQMDFLAQGTCHVECTIVDD